MLQLHGFFSSGTLPEAVAGDTATIKAVEDLLKRERKRQRENAAGGEAAPAAGKVTPDKKRREVEIPCDVPGLGSAGQTEPAPEDAAQAPVATTESPIASPAPGIQASGPETQLADGLPD